MVRKLNNALPYNACGSILNNSISYSNQIVIGEEKTKERCIEVTDGAVPLFKVTKSSSILRAVKGLTVIVAAYSRGEFLFILYHTL